MRYLGLATDPEPGGSTYDVLAEAGAPGDPVDFTAPDYFIPVTTGQVNRNPGRRERNDEVRGIRGATAPTPGTEQPELTFGSRAYPKVLRYLIPAAFSGAPANAGVAPAAITSKVEPIDGSGTLKTLMGTLVREGQTDFVSGLAVGEWSMELPADGDGTVTATLPGLYHEARATAAPVPANYAGHRKPFSLMRVSAYIGATPVKIDCLSGLTLGFNNGLSDEFEDRFCAGENVVFITKGGERYEVQYPTRHVPLAQAITGELRFGTVRPDMEERMLLAETDKLVIELAAGPLGTTPPVDEMLRFTLDAFALSEGSADELVREGNIRSAYQFGAYVSETTGKDISAEFVGSAAIGA